MTLRYQSHSCVWKNLRLGRVSVFPLVQCHLGAKFPGPRSFPQNIFLKKPSAGADKAKEEDLISHISWTQSERVGCEILLFPNYSRKAGEHLWSPLVKEDIRSAQCTEEE